MLEAKEAKGCNKGKTKQTPNNNNNNNNLYLSGIPRMQTQLSETETSPRKSENVVVLHLWFGVSESLALYHDYMNNLGKHKAELTSFSPHQTVTSSC